MPKAKNRFYRNRHFRFNVVEDVWVFGIRKNKKVIYRNYDTWSHPSRKPESFEGREVMNPTDARRLIGWLASYLNWADPDSTTEAIARTKADTRSINRQMDIISKECAK